MIRQAKVAKRHNIHADKHIPVASGNPFSHNLGSLNSAWENYINDIVRNNRRAVNSVNLGFTSLNKPKRLRNFLCYYAISSSGIPQSNKNASIGSSRILDNDFTTQFIGYAWTCNGKSRHIQKLTQEELKTST